MGRTVVTRVYTRTLGSNRKIWAVRSRTATSMDGCLRRLWLCLRDSNGLRIVQEQLPKPEVGHVWFIKVGMFGD